MNVRFFTDVGNEIKKAYEAKVYGNNTHASLIRRKRFQASSFVQQLHLHDYDSYLSAVFAVTGFLMSQSLIGGILKVGVGGLMGYYFVSMLEELLAATSDNSGRPAAWAQAIALTTDGREEVRAVQQYA